MNRQRITQTGQGQHLDLLHWLLFLLAVCGAYVIGPPAAIAQENTRSGQHELQPVEAPNDTPNSDAPGTIRDAPPGDAPDSSNADTTTPDSESSEDARAWNDRQDARDEFAQEIVGSWRIDLTQFMTRQLAENGRPGLAMIAGALSQELFGESYGIVTANADGSGAARGVWFGENVEGEGSWEVLAVDGEHARIRLVVPEYGIDRIFEIRLEDDRVHAQYQGLPAVFVRQ